MNRIIEFFVGLLFGIGLLVSGMTDPGKVLGFLDLAGAWDPSLAFVMGGAILVGVIAFTVAKKRTQTFLGDALHLPTSRLVAMGAGELKAALFVAAMMGGMFVFEILDRRARR